MKANEGRVLDVVNEGKDLIKENHYRKDDIQAKGKFASKGPAQDCSFVGILI